MKRIKVVSLFDGISTGYLALKNAGFEIERYVAFEIDKYSIKVSEKNFPEIEHRGSVIGANFSEFKDFDLVIGGSPCQDLSSQNVKGKGLDGEKSKLFFEFVRALKEINPKWFLLENVYSMTKENKDRITAEMGVKPIMIDSCIFSAQSRKRLYWTNIPNIRQPEKKKNFAVKDIMLSAESVPEKYWLNKDFDFYGTKKRIAGLIHRNVIYRTISEIYNIEFPSRTLTCDKRMFFYQNGKVRRLTPLEWERLQTLPDNYTEGISETNRYKAIGNGWTSKVVEYIFSFIPD